MHGLKRKKRERKRRKKINYRKWTNNCMPSGASIEQTEGVRVEGASWLAERVPAGSSPCVVSRTALAPPSTSPPTSTSPHTTTLTSTRHKSCRLTVKPCKTIHKPFRSLHTGSRHFFLTQSFLVSFTDHYCIPVPSTILHHLPCFFFMLVFLINDLRFSSLVNNALS